MNQLIQGDIYLADLNPVKGHEQGGYRPVLILQNSILNKNLNTVIVAPITKNLKAKGYLTTFFLPKRLSKLNVNSVILLFQIRTIDKNRLRKRISCLDQNHLRKIMEQLSLVF